MRLKEPMKEHNTYLPRLRLKTGFMVYIFMQSSYISLLPPQIYKLIKLRSRIDLHLIHLKANSTKYLEFKIIVLENELIGAL